MRNFSECTWPFLFFLSPRFSALGAALERLPRVFHERWSGNLFTFSAGHKLVTITKLQLGSFSLLEAEKLIQLTIGLIMRLQHADHGLFNISWLLWITRIRDSSYSAFGDCLAFKDIQSPTNLDAQIKRSW